MQPEINKPSGTFTAIRVTLTTKDALRGIASLKVADAIFLTGLRIVDGKSGLFIAMPAKKKASGDYQDIYFPASKEKRDELAAVVLAAYAAELKKAGIAS